MPYLIFSVIILFLAASVYLGRKIYVHGYLPRFSDKTYPVLQRGVIDPKVQNKYPGAFLYPVDMQACLKWYEFNEDGIIEYLDWTIKRMHPTLTCLFTYLSFEKYLKTGDEAALNDFNKHIDYLEKHIKYSDDGEAIMLPFEFDFFIEKAPWTSAITSAFFISALVRKYVIAKDEKYATLVKKAFEFLNRPSGNLKGTRFSDDKMEVWFEEDTHNHHILNGNIFSVFAVYELAKCFDDKLYKEAYEKAIRSIKANTNRYDLGFYTRYDLSKGSICNNAYHNFHITMFYTLYKMTGDEFFKKYADKFARYQKSVISRARLFFYLYFKALFAKFKIVI